VLLIEAREEGAGCLMGPQGGCGMQASSHSQRACLAACCQLKQDCTMLVRADYLSNVLTAGENSPPLAPHMCVCVCVRLCLSGR
jgi:hypothetical protein